jgi:flavin reductase (DIM6/NTAB) family NADH-FMN oxidoreductase RutF
MVRGATLNLECRLVKEESMGDHTVFVGEVLSADAGEKEPLVYHGLKYWAFGKTIEKPSDAEMTKIKAIVEKHKR